MGKFVLVCMGLCIIIASLGTVASAFYVDTKGITMGLALFTIIMGIISLISLGNNNGW